MAMYAAFTSPGLLPALLLAAVPLLLHLLARRRFQRISWAATSLLQQAHRRFRKKVEIRDLLLLLLRTGVVVLAVLAAAGPRVSPSSWLGELTSRDREVVLLVDTSASMGALYEGVTRLRRAVARCFSLLEGLRPSDRVTLATFDRTFRFVVRESPDPGPVRRHLEHLAPSPYQDDPLAALVSLGKDLRSRPGLKDVHVFSHFPGHSWHRMTGASLPGTTTGEDPIRWFLVPVREMDPGNLSLTRIRFDPVFPVRGESTQIRIRIENLTDSCCDRRLVTLKIHGEKPRRRPITVPAGGSLDVTFHHRFPVKGQGLVEARLDSDSLPADNAAFAVVNVGDTPLVTLVSRARPGKARKTPFQGDLDFVAAALEAGLEDGDKILALDRLSPERLAQEGPGHATVIVVSGLPSPDPALADRLTGFLSTGGSILFAPSPALRPGEYNEVFHGSGHGNRARKFPLPFRLKDAADLPPGTAPFLTPAGQDHPALAFLAGLRPDLLQRASLHRIVTPAALPAHAKVLLRCGHQTGDPLLVETAHGGGRVFWFSTTLTPHWTDLPTPARGNHLFVPLMKELVRMAAHPEVSAPPPGVSGHPLCFPFPAGPLPHRLQVLDPDGLPAGTPRLDLRNNGTRLVTLPHAGRPGFYRLRALGPGSKDPGEVHRVRAVTHDPVESHPASLQDTDLAALFPDRKLQVLTGKNPVLAGPGRTGPLDSLLLAGLGVLLLLESFLACIFGRERT